MYFLGLPWNIMDVNLMNLLLYGVFLWRIWGGPMVNRCCCRTPSLRHTPVVSRMWILAPYWLTHGVCTWSVSVCRTSTHTALWLSHFLIFNSQAAAQSARFSPEVHRMLGIEKRKNLRLTYFSFTCCVIVHWSVFCSVIVKKKRATFC